ncbi:MAG: aminotransferase class IV [Bacteroidales bacterium]
MYIESIRAEFGELHHLEYHCKRIRRSVGAKNCDLILSELVGFANQLPEARSKFRFVYNDCGILEYSVTPYQLPRITSLRMIEGGEIDYSLKYARREELNALFALRGSCDDVLICKKGFLTDTSFCNVVVETPSGELLTPLHPLLSGTARQRLLDRGVIREAPIDRNILHNCERIRLVNAMIDLEDEIYIDRSHIL